MNMGLAMLLSDDVSEADGCDWYFISLFVDVFIGVAFCFIIVKGIETFAAYNGIEFLNTGVYVHEDYSSIDTAQLDPIKQIIGRSIDYRIWAV